MIKFNIVPAFRKLTHILTLAVLLRAPLTNAIMVDGHPNDLGVCGWLFE